MESSEERERDFLRNYRAQFNDLKNKTSRKCPPADELLRYFNHELPNRKSRKIEDHIDSCPFCLAALQGLRRQEKTQARKMASQLNWHEIEQELDGTFYSSFNSISFAKRQKKQCRKRVFESFQKKWHTFLNFSAPSRLLAYAGSLALILLIGLYSFAFFSRTTYFNLAEIKPSGKITLRSGGTASSLLSQGLHLFREKKYKQAIAKLTPYLADHPDNYFANRYLGLAHLLIAPKGLPGMPYGFKNSEVKQGINYLQKALALSEGNEFYQEDCLWYLGKACLMLGDKAQAISNFQAITHLNQHNILRKEDAKVMISQLR